MAECAQESRPAVGVDESRYAAAVIVGNDGDGDSERGRIITLWAEKNEEKSPYLK